ncbi:MAG: hypothetical protein ABJL55_12855 [Roseibium sp.]
MNAPDNERRLSPATRTRLRGGRLLDMDENLISKCTLYDLENGNVGIVVPDAEIEIPGTVYIQDDKDLFIVLAKIRWRMGPNLGIAYLEQPVSLGLREKTKTQSSG